MSIASPVFPHIAVENAAWNNKFNSFKQSNFMLENVPINLLDGYFNNNLNFSRPTKHWPKIFYSVRMWLALGQMAIEQNSVWIATAPYKRGSKLYWIFKKKNPSRQNSVTVACQLNGVTDVSAITSTHQHSLLQHKYLQSFKSKIIGCFWFCLHTCMCVLLESRQKVMTFFRIIPHSAS